MLRKGWRLLAAGSGLLKSTTALMARSGSFQPFTQKDENDLLQVVKTKPKHVLKHVRQQVWRSRKKELHFRNTVTHLMIILQEFLRKQLIDPVAASQIMEGVLEECVKYGQHDMAHLLFRALLRFRKYGCVTTVNSIRFLFESYKQNDSTELMLQLASEMKAEANLRPLCIAAYLFGGQEGEAMSLMEGLALTDLGADDLLALVAGYEKNGNDEKILEIVKSVERNGKVDSAAAASIFDAAFRAFYRQRKEASFDAVLQSAVEHHVNLLPSSFATILRQKALQATTVQEIAGIEEELAQLGYAADATCSSIVITAYARLLHFGERGSEELMLSKVNTLLSSIESRLKQGDPDMDISAAHIRAVLRGYGAAGRPDSMKDAWQRMQFKGLTNDVRIYNELFKWLAIMGNVKDVLALREEMERNGVNPDAMTFTWMFRALGKYYPRHVEELYSDLQQRRVRPDVQLYTTLVGIFGDLGQRERVEELVKEMRSREASNTLQFTPITFAVLIRVYARDLEKAQQLYKEAVQRNLGDHPHVQTSMLHALTIAGGGAKGDTSAELVDKFVAEIPHWGTDVYNVLLNMYGKRMDRESFNRTLERMKTEGVAMNDVTFGTLITAFARWGESEKVNEVIQLLKDHEGEISATFYSVLASSLNRLGNAEGVESAWEDLLSSKLFPDTEVYNQFLSLYSRQHNLPKMQGVLDSMMKQVPPNPVTATTVLDMLGKSGRVAEMESLFADMKSTPDTAPTSVTYHQMLNAYAKSGDVTKMDQIFDDFVAQGHVADNVTYNILMDGVGRAKDFERMEELRAKRAESGIPMDDIAYCILVCAYGRSRMEGEVTRLFNEIASDECKPFQTRRVLWSACDAFCRCGDEKGMDRAIELLKSTSREAGTLGSSDLNGLIPYYCRLGQMERVEELRANLREQGAPLTYFALNAVARGYARAGRFDKTVECLHQIRDNNWIPDAATALQLSAAFLKAGLPEQAQQIVEWRRHYAKSVGEEAHVGAHAAEMAMPKETEVGSSPKAE